MPGERRTMSTAHRSARYGIEFDVRQVEESLKRIEDVFVRSKVLPDGMRKALAPIARQGRKLVSQPGSPGYWPRVGKQRLKRKPLKDSIGSVVRQYDKGGARGAVIVGVVGPQYPAGAIGHLVELGHRMVHGGSVGREATSRWAKKGLPKARSKRGVTGGGRVTGRVAGKPFMRPAFEQHAPRATQIIIDTVQKAIEKGAKK